MLKYYLDGSDGDVKVALFMFFNDHPQMKLRLAQIPRDLLVEYLSGQWDASYTR
jgi:hypothetical protein